MDRTISSTQLRAQRTSETTDGALEVQQVENQKLSQVVILHKTLHGESEHVSICTQFFF